MSLQWAFNVVVSQMYLVSQDKIGIGNTFLVFGAVSIVVWVYGFIYLAETKLKTLDEIKYTNSRYTPILL